MSEFVDFPDEYYINNTTPPPDDWSAYRFTKACAAHLNAHRRKKEPAVSVEDKSYLDAVHAWRNLWRPETVRLLVIGESHVAQSIGDHAVRVAVPGAPKPFPDRFVRLMYCVGYGEPSVCTGGGPNWENSVTPYWRILMDMGGPVRQYGGRYGSVNTKLDVLVDLKARGIWLVDAVIFGVYRVQPLPRLKINDYMIQTSFSRYVWPELAGEPIKDIWVLGTNIGKALMNKPPAGMPAIKLDHIVPNNPYDPGVDRLIAASKAY